jgi:hypothetical protein
MLDFAVGNLVRGVNNPNFSPNYSDIPCAGVNTKEVAVPEV